MNQSLSFDVIPDIINRESILLVSDGFRLTTCRNDLTVRGFSPSRFTPRQTGEGGAVLTASLDCLREG